MAISKTQPMRSAEIELIDTVNEYMHEMHEIECGEFFIEDLQPNSYTDRLINFTNPFSTRPVLMYGIQESIDFYEPILKKVMIMPTRVNTNSMTVRIYNDNVSTVSLSIGWIATTAGKHD